MAVKKQTSRRLQEYDKCFVVLCVAEIIMHTVDSEGGSVV